MVNLALSLSHTVFSSKCLQRLARHCSKFALLLLLLLLSTPLLWGHKTVYLLRVGSANSGGLCSNLSRRIARLSCNHDHKNSDCTMGCFLTRGVWLGTDLHSQVYQLLPMFEPNFLELPGAIGSRLENPELCHRDRIAKGHQ